MPGDHDFSDNEVRERFADIYVSAEAFLERFSVTRPTSFAVDPSRLYLAVVSAYIDISRYKNYHLDDPRKDLSDAIKRCGFLSKWILRFKPIHPNPPNGELVIDDSALVNEAFVICIVATHLSAEAMHHFRFSPLKTFELLYDFAYRRISADGLMQFYKSVYDLLVDNKFIIDI